MTQDLQAAHQRLTLLSGQRDQKPVVTLMAIYVNHGAEMPGQPSAFIDLPYLRS
jgi:hypothetical protein